jgi:hypothetical protein
MAASVRRHPAASQHCLPKARLSKASGGMTPPPDCGANAALTGTTAPQWLTSRPRQDASPSGFARSIATFRYHVQASHYLTGLHGAERFVFIAVEKTAPYAVAVYELDAAAMAAGDEHGRDMRVIATAKPLTSGLATAMTAKHSMPSWALTANPTITSDDF